MRKEIEGDEEVEKESQAFKLKDDEANYGLTTYMQL